VVVILQVDKGHPYTVPLKSVSSFKDELQTIFLLFTIIGSSEPLRGFWIEELGTSQDANRIYVT
jgi:hypothetical protein